MQCRACGQENDAGLRFCVACGHSLTDEAAGPTNRPGASVSLLSPGTVLKSTYEIIRLLGEGGAGAVYEARHVDLGHAVAVKVLFGQLARIGQIRERFVEEGRIQANLKHPNIVRVGDIVDDGHVVAIVMEFIEGETLHDYIQRQSNPVPVLRAGQILLKVLAGLEAAHARGIVHRDIKPGNIMMAQSTMAQGDEGVVPKLCDFGIAKVASAENRTVTGTKMGTLHYMAPEQFQDAARVDRRADIYSLGVTFFELLTRRLPFETDNDYQLMRAHIELKAPSPKGMRPDLSVALSSFVLRALEKRPDERFQSCREMMDALAELPGFEGLKGLASYPGVPVSDDLIPPPDRAIRRTRAPSLTSVTSLADGGRPSEPRSRRSGPGGVSERARPTRTERPDRLGDRGRGARRRVAWFPVFLGVFAAVLAGVVVLWVMAQNEGGQPALAAGREPQADGPKPFDDGRRPAAAPSGPTTDAAEGMGEPAGVEADGRAVATWSLEACESLAEEVADLGAVHDLDEVAGAELLERLRGAERACRDLLVPSLGSDDYLLRYGQTQMDRLTIASRSLRARAAGSEEDAACMHVMIASQAADRAVGRLRRTAESAELSDYLRDNVGALGRSMVEEQEFLQSRYLHCFQGR